MTSHDPLAIERHDAPEPPAGPTPDAKLPVDNGSPPPAHGLPPELLKQLAEHAHRSRAQGFHRRRNKRYWMK